MAVLGKSPCFKDGLCWPQMFFSPPLLRSSRKKKKEKRRRTEVNDLTDKEETGRNGNLSN